MKKYRVFTNGLGWSDVMYLFDNDTTFVEIKNNPRTKFLDKENYIGTYDFDKNFLKLFNKTNIGNKEYYYRFSYQKDDLTPEERKWKMIPEFVETDTKKQKQHKDIDIQEGFSNASESLF